MKSVFKAFMLAALLAIPAGTYAQSSFFHAGLVASGGIDGLAGGLAIGLGNHIQIRVMYGYIPEFSKEVPDYQQSRHQCSRDHHYGRKNKPRAPQTPC